MSVVYCVNVFYYRGMHPVKPTPRSTKTKAKVESIVRQSILDLGVMPFAVLIRSAIHPSTEDDDEFEEDQPHVTFSYKLSQSNTHMSAHANLDGGFFSGTTQTGPHRDNSRRRYKRTPVWPHDLENERFFFATYEAVSEDSSCYH